METVADFIFVGSKITADSDCSHKIKRCLLLSRKAMTNLDGLLKNRDTILPTKVCIVKTMVFPLVTYGCESWAIKKAEHWKTGAFKLWCWRGPLRVPWTARRSKQSTLKEINSECSLEGLMLKLKPQSFTWCEEPTHWKRLDAGKDWGQEEKGATEDEMVGWYQWLSGHEFERAPGDGEGQGSLACCSPWSLQESDTAEQLNNKWWW